MVKKKLKKKKKKFLAWCLVGCCLFKQITIIKEKKNKKGKQYLVAVSRGHNSKTSQRRDSFGGECSTG